MSDGPTDPTPDGSVEPWGIRYPLPNQPIRRGQLEGLAVSAGAAMTAAVQQATSAGGTAGQQAAQAVLTPAQQARDDAIAARNIAQTAAAQASTAARRAAFLFAGY